MFGGKELNATGTHSLRQLLEELTARGLTNRPTGKRPARPLHMSKLATLLRNPYYIGVVTYRGVEYEGKHPRLVDPELFATVQDVLRAHDVAGERQRTHPHYLRGSLFCARCGERIGYGLARGNGGIYPYFFCYGRHRGNGCDLPYTAEATVEQWVLDNYSTVQLEPERVEEVRTMLKQELDAERRQSARELKRQEARLARLTDERAKLLQAHYAGAIPLELLKTEQERISRGIEEANRLLSARDIQFAQIEKTLNMAIDIAANCHQAFRDAGDKIRRELNQVFFTKLLLDQDGIAGSELTDEYAALLAEDMARRFRRAQTEPSLSGVGSIKRPLVDLRGVEP